MSNQTTPNETVEDARLRFLVSVNKLLRASQEAERDRNRLMELLRDGPRKQETSAS